MIPVLAVEDGLSATPSIPPRLGELA
jgi:hypothetical protein